MTVSPRLTKLDAKAWRSLASAFVLFGGVGLVLLFAAPLLGIDREASLKAWLAGAAQGPWALPVAVLVFAGLAFLGVPQVALIAAAVVAFGPQRGMAYSWAGTMVSSLIGFGLGRWFGGRLLETVAGEGVQRFMAMIGRNGFVASFLVRLAPSAPFIVVNMAAGITPMRLIDFVAGTALGIVPKIVLTGMAGRSLMQAAGGGGLREVLLIVLSVGAWVAIGFAARIWLKRRSEQA
ncbi:TVP38/TMEM64 family protein [Phenylobacterium montanum]|uniref:TVP38/TMEM64 family membrane protein n=1 Tax=Phenylobacterium montanum TaxID=2823693 RepID=A0A975G3R0_9CAUL|nr:TVP38/TMEM64 family protein [Caulobacter sp. S6]QUD89994.1 TVP38/TMEM64 family protein [Caulobacter sp. S6]